MDPLNTSDSDNFRSFFEAINDMIVVGTPQGEVLYINSALKKELGYTLDEVKAIGILGLNPIEKRAEAEANFAAMIKGELDYCPLAIVAKDGRKIPAETRIAFGKWDGKDCIFGISKDMTQQKAALEKFEKIFSNNPIPIAISSTLDQKFQDVNQAFLDVLEYNKEDIIGHTAKEINLFVDLNQQIQIATKLKENGMIRNEELIVRKKSGETLTGLFSGDIIENQTGEKVFLTSMINITEIKEIKQGLQEKSTLLTNLLSSIPDIIFFKDLNGVYLGCNPAFLNFTGKDENEIVGKTDYDIFDKDVADTFREQDKLMLQKGESRHNEEWVTYPDGTSILLDTYKAPLKNINGEIIGLVGVSRDITERKKKEDEMSTLNDLMLGRELKMVDLKEKIAELEEQVKKG
ncbi:MAG: PAS domain S-box protein [bacterium]